jgi:hypothetical protein
MSSDQDSPAFLRAPRPRTALAVSLVLALAIVSVDVFSNLHHDLAIAYAIPIVLCGWSQSRAWVLALSAALIGFDLLLDYASHPAGTGFLDLHVVLSVVRLAIVAAVGQIWAMTVRELDRSRTSLERQNAELENVNDELRPIARRRRYGRARSCSRRPRSSSARARSSGSPTTSSRIASACWSSCSSSRAR